MNGWNGMTLPGIAGYTGAVGPLSMGSYAPINPVSAAPTISAPSITPNAGIGGYESWMGGSGTGTGAKPGGWFGIEGLGKNLQTLQAGVGLLSGAAGVWNALQQNKLAKQNFNYQRGLMDTNLANSIRSFNLSLDDKMRSRQVVEGMSDSERQAYMDRYSARDERRG